MRVLLPWIFLGAAAAIMHAVAGRDRFHLGEVSTAQPCDLSTINRCCYNWET